MGFTPSQIREMSFWDFRDVYKGFTKLYPQKDQPTIDGPTYDEFVSAQQMIKDRQTETSELPDWVQQEMGMMPTE